MAMLDKPWHGVMSAAMDTQNKPNLALSLPKELKRELRVAAARRDTSMGGLLREIVVAWLSEKKEARHG
jgi:plasmid stability protein